MALGTIVLAYYTFDLAKKTAHIVEEEKHHLETNLKRSNADFIYLYKKDFFTPQFTQLFTMLDNNQILFISDPSNRNYWDTLKSKHPKAFPPNFNSTVSNKFPSNFPIFWISQNYKGTLPVTIDNREYYTSYEIDDILLNPLDNLNLYFESQMIIDTNYVNTAFGWYTNVIWESKPIKEYALWLRHAYNDETAHMHGVENLYFLLRHNFLKNVLYSDDTISFKNDTSFRCDKGLFIMCKPTSKDFQHESLN